MMVQRKRDPHVVVNDRYWLARAIVDREQSLGSAEGVSGAGKRSTVGGPM